MRFLWSETINIAVFIINRSPTIANLQVAPIQQFFGKLPDISFLTAFRSKVHVWIEKNKRDKLNAEMKLQLFIECDDLTKSFRI